MSVLAKCEFTEICAEEVCEPERRLVCERLGRCIMSLQRQMPSGEFTRGIPPEERIHHNKKAEEISLLGGRSAETTETWQVPQCTLGYVR